jgi:hypothetical protein
MDERSASICHSKDNSELRIYLTLKILGAGLRDVKTVLTLVEPENMSRTFAYKDQTRQAKTTRFAIVCWNQAGTVHASESPGPPGGGPPRSWAAICHASRSGSPADQWQNST